MRFLHLLALFSTAALFSACMQNQGGNVTHSGKQKLHQECQSECSQQGVAADIGQTTLTGICHCIGNDGTSSVVHNTILGNQELTFTGAAQ